MSINKESFSNTSESLELVDYLKSNKLKIGDSCINKMGMSTMIQTEYMVNIFTNKAVNFKVKPI